MFKSVLIANRGEIACRIMRTAKRLGMRTVAVYSDADADALHVRLADEAHHIGPAPAAESYLRIDRIIDVARTAAVDAIHPGYGFLSENARFAEAVTQAGIVFVGPSSNAIEAMGLKDAAKAVMEKAGIPVVPGYHGERQDAVFMAKQAAAVGYPVLIKARAGGGGKGMRRVERPEDFADALASAKREARSSFGDDGCLIERCIARPRHIEMQVFGDSHGNVVHLFERDCSLQRRHQKVMEEAPAPGVSSELRETLGAMAVRAAQAIGYLGAGTVEFVADCTDGLRPDRVYFMEMNTRLQVEHPVTEAITGQDLVEWQFRVAAGEKLPLSQEQLTIDGWAIEARVYSEDPARDFLPTTGVLHHVSFPSASVRVDAGVRQGETIGTHYDPMIAKVIVHGRSRAEALGALRRALRESLVAGVVTNLGFLKRLCDEPDFVSGDVDTGLIARALDRLTNQAVPPRDVLAVAAIGALGVARPRDDGDPWSRLVGWRHFSDARQFALLEWGGRLLDIRVSARGGNAFNVFDDGSPLSVDVLDCDGVAMRIAIAGRISNAKVVEHRDSLTIQYAGETYAFGLPDRLAELAVAEDATSDRILSPMPGLVKAVLVSTGCQVAKGQAMIAIEAMKMEHTLVAPRDGTIAAVAVSPNDHVESGGLLVTLEPEDG